MDIESESTVKIQRVEDSGIYSLCTIDVISDRSGLVTDAKRMGKDLVKHHKKA